MSASTFTAIGIHLSTSVSRSVLPGADCVLPGEVKALLTLRPPQPVWSNQQPGQRRATHEPEIFARMILVPLPVGRQENIVDHHVQ